MDNLIIGGKSDTTEEDEFGKFIDIKNIDTDASSTKVLQMEFDREDHSCIVVPNGIDGHPTVAICKPIMFYQFHVPLEDDVSKKDFAQMV